MREDPEDRRGDVVWSITDGAFALFAPSKAERLQHRVVERRGDLEMSNRDGDMIYKAAVLESFEGEAEKLGCEKFIIEKGEYLIETLKDWKKDESQIGLTFRKFSESKYNATFPCVEWYQGNDVMCMVKLENHN